MLGNDGLCTTASLKGFEGDYETPCECKRKRRQSVGDFVKGALNKQIEHPLLHFNKIEQPRPLYHH